MLQHTKIFINIYNNYKLLVCYASFHICNMRQSEVNTAWYWSFLILFILIDRARDLDELKENIIQEIRIITIDILEKS